MTLSYFRSLQLEFATSQTIERGVLVVSIMKVILRNIYCSLINLMFPTY